MLGATTEGDAGEEDGGVIRKFSEEAIIHENDVRLNLLEL